MVNLKSLLLSLLTVVLLSTYCGAATFVVVTNADSGPGTLRQALTDAATNGNSAIDNITFNLPAGEQTINVLTALPAITSSVIIDGSTQPGAALTPNGAKVTLVGPGSGEQFNCFEIHDADDVEIYGFVIKDFHFILSNGFLTGSAAIALMGTSSKIIIGAPGKGNVMYDNGTGIANAPVTGYSPDIAYCEIRNNYIGMMEDGTSFNGNEGDAVVLSYTHRVVVGGNATADGNAFYGNFTISPYFDGSSNTLANNIFGASAGYLTPSNFNATNTQVYLVSNLSNAAQQSTFLVTNNVFATMLSASGFKNIGLTIQGNVWGESRSGNIPLLIPGPAISLTNLTGTILIGGSDDSYANTITNTVTNGANITARDAMIEATKSTTVELSHNSIFCNSKSNNNPSFVYMNTARDNQPVTITLDAVTGATVSGTTKPNARVELFYTDKECSGCEPEKYIASVNADISGNWVYNGTIDPDFNVVANATLNKMSSEFSNPEVDFSGNIQPVTCSELGSITGVQVSNAHVSQWYDASGKPAGPPGPDLINAEPGGYYLVLNQFGCSYKSPIYTILDKRPVLDQSSLNTTDATCGLANGSITGLVATNYQSIQWLDANGNAVPGGAGIDLTGVPAGTYTLRLFGPDCHTDFSPFTVGSKKDVITISADFIQVSPDQCGQSLGSIKGITANGGTAPLSYSWTDVNGKIISTAADATGLSAGKYTLTVSDASCGSAKQSFNITGEMETLPPPQANDVKVCGNAAVLKVKNVQNGYTYKLYGDDVSTSPLQTESSGIFTVSSTVATSYYLSEALGSCESDRTKVTVTHSNDIGGSVPNAFTPNGDGINDNWQLDGLAAYPQAEVQVFNRYGQRVYLSHGYNVPWDGTYKGLPLPVGTYYYIITVGNNACKLLSGYVAILR